MKRLRPLLLLGALVAVAAASAASAGGPQPAVGTPNPLLSSATLDYPSPICDSRGTCYPRVQPLRMTAIKASVLDLEFLEYERRDDLGGFIPAPIGWLALGYCLRDHPGTPCPGVSTSGKLGPTQVPLFSRDTLRGHKVDSYTWLHGVPGEKRCAACGITSQHLFNGGAFVLPPRNNCFSGCNAPGGGGRGGTRTTGSGTSTVNSRGGGNRSPGDCGTAGISIVSNLRHCRIYVVNEAPGDGTTEQMRIQNTSGTPYVLSLRAAGSSNELWDDLEMGVWKRGATPPDPLPPLHFWTRKYNPLVTLRPRQVVHLTIELYLPVFAGNNDQHLTAVVDFRWRAVGRPSS